MNNEWINKRIKLAHTPTPISKLENLSNKVKKNIYIKRDDLTGLELSGNKVRKLEFSLYEAIQNNADVVITCGAVQSNHARATATACRMLGLTPHLVLRGAKPELYKGNLLMDKILDCKIDYLTNTEFLDINKILVHLKEEYMGKGINAYIIPVGASNGVGNFGYWNAYNEILTQEKELGIKFSSVITTVGSGGTFSGLNLGNMFNGNLHKIVGYSIGGSKEYFEKICLKIMRDTIDLISSDIVSIGFNSNMITSIEDNYQGDGYAIPYKEEIETIKMLAKLEGIILDPVYTGKCFHGLLTDINLGKYENDNNILFIHTGGHFGIESFSNLF